MTYCVDLFLNTKLLTLRLFNSPGAKARRGKKINKKILPWGEFKVNKNKNKKKTLKPRGQQNSFLLRNNKSQGLFSLC